MNLSVRERYERHYTQKVGDFIRDIGSVNAVGIPEVHLPLWGSDYETAQLRLAFIGRDTKLWGNMPSFINEATQNLQTAIFRNENKFRSLAFAGWTNNFGSSFWDTVMQFLAAFYNIPDWKEIKRRQHDDILRRFVWAETNAVELW